MKKVVKLTALSLGLAFASSAVLAQDNIAFVNTEYLLVNHPARQVELQKLEAEFKGPEEKLRASEKALQEKKVAFEKEIDGKVKALEKDAAKLRKADIQKRQDEISKLAQKRDTEFRALVEAHQKELAALQQAGQKRDAEITQRFVSDINTAVKTVAQAKNYNIVLDTKTAVYAVDGKNITEEVLKAIPAPAAAPAAQAPAQGK